MSIYRKETIKIYLDLTVVAPQEPQAYHLKVTETEVYWLDEIDV